MSNESEKSSRKEKLLAFLKELDTKGEAGNSGKELLKSLVVTGAGLALGTLIGRPSLVVGAGATYAGYYLGSPKLCQMGIAIMTSGGYQLAQKGLSGEPSEGMEGVKERFKALRADLKERLYLDKFIKPKPKAVEEGTNGLGEVQYFKYPNPEVNMAGLDAIEDEITRSSEKYAESRQMSGAYDDMGDIGGIEERNL